MKNQLVISKNYRYVNRVTLFTDDGKGYGVFESIVLIRLPQNYRTGDVIFITMQSLAGVEFRTATLVAEELHQLGYSLALGREVVNESSRMGLPDEFTLQREFERARQQGALAQWIAAFEGGFTGSSPPWIPVAPVRGWLSVSIWTRWISVKSRMSAIAPTATVLRHVTPE